MSMANAKINDKSQIRWQLQKSNSMAIAKINGNGNCKNQWQ
jgi:hypothetical protein